MDNKSIRPVRRIGKLRFAISSTNAAIMQILIVLLTFFTLLTPRDTLGLKKIFLALALLWGIGSIINGLKKNKVILCFSLAVPVLMYILSSIDTGSVTKAFSYLYPFVYLLLVFPIVDWNIDIEKICLYVGNIMAIIIILSCILDFVGILDIYVNPLLSWLNINDEAKISKSMYAMFRYVLFFKASPILFYNLTHYIKKNNKFYIALSFIALLFTGTRANIYLGAALLVYAMLFYTKKTTAKVSIIVVAIAVVVLFGGELLVRYQLLAFAKSDGDISRAGGFGSIIAVMNSHKSYWFTGMGFGSTYFNAGKHAFVETSELSYLEFVREIGIPFSAIVFGFLLYPLIKVYKNEKFAFVFYTAYLVAGIFEPFIFTSTGFFVVMLMYCKMEMIRMDPQVQ